MSYILDALKKAEADRDPDTRAKLAFEVRERRRSRFITYAVLAALIANAVILLWLFLPDDLGSLPLLDSAAQEPMAPAPTPLVPAPGPETAAVEAASMPPPPVSSPVVAMTPEVETRISAADDGRPGDASAVLGPDEILIRPSATSTPAEPVAVAGLPDAARRRFPSLSFSTHIYADDPDLRAVVVNGRRLREGDRLGELTLERITEEGAVFRFEGRQVEVGVLEEWN